MKLQAEAARGKLIDEKPVFAVIQPASVPLLPDNSRKKVMIIKVVSRDNQVLATSSKVASRDNQVLATSSRVASRDN